MPAPLAIALALLAAVPAAAVRFGGLAVPVELATLLFGIAVVGGAFAMAWAAEAAEREIPRALALSAVALLAVFPEYAVDLIFAYKAGQEPTFAPYAAANMTGSNRLLLGLGWPAVSILAWLTRRDSELPLRREASLPLLFLAAATLYSFSLPLRRAIALVDSLVLIALFVGYVVLAARDKVDKPHLVGPAAAVAGLPKPSRRLVILALFAFAALAIGASAEPFADGMVRTGQKIGLDEFLLVQWLAPLASESPEFVVACVLVLRGQAVGALALLLSAKLNQWTVLVGSLPIAFSVGVGHAAALPLDGRQVAEVLLTAAQSLLGVAVLASLSLALWESILLAGLFMAQLVAGAVLRAALHNTQLGEIELYAFSALYLVLAVAFLVRARVPLGRCTSICSWLWTAHPPRSEYSTTPKR